MKRKKRPQASFTYTVSGLTVTFTDTSTRSPSGWLWHFGDGTTSTQQNPTKTYATAGTYDVTLYAFNRAGQSIGVTVPVAVQAVSSSWDDVMTSYTPTHRYTLTEASGDPVNSGTAGGVALAQGTPAYRVGSLIRLDAGWGVENGDGWAFSKSEMPTVTTTVMLIRTPISLTQTNYVADASQLFVMRVLADGTLQFIDDLVLVTVSSAPGVVKSNQWNLIAFQPNPAGGSKIFHTSQDAGGVVTQVASGGAPAIGFIGGGVMVRGSSSANTATIGELAVIDGALTLSQLQALADTLNWS